MYIMHFHHNTMINNFKISSQHHIAFSFLFDLVLKDTLILFSEPKNIDKLLMNTNNYHKSNNPK